MTFYYELQYSNYMADDITDEVIFLGDRFTSKDLEQAADTLAACHPEQVKDIHDIKALISFIVASDHHYILDEVLNGYAWLVDSIIPEWYPLDVGTDWPGGFHDFTIISQLLDEEFLVNELECVTNEILDLVSDDMDILEDYLASLGYTLGTVGYSNWTYYIAVYDGESYFRDLWEGYNFYDILEYNDIGDLVDSVGACYIKNDGDLANCLMDHFQTKPEDIKLLKSEYTEFTDYPVYMRVPTAYEFIKC